MNVEEIMAKIMKEEVMEELIMGLILMDMEE